MQKGKMELRTSTLRHEDDSVSGARLMTSPRPPRIAAVMQPYFLPYIGYFHLMAVADVFVIYDRIKYTKKGWINRNRYLSNGAPCTFSLPLRNAPDDTLICERELAAEFDPSRLLRRWESAYRGAPYINETLTVLERVLYVPHRNLFHFLLLGLEVLRTHLSLPSVLKVSSEIESQSFLRAQERVISLVKDVKATIYVNPVGGQGLYQPANFAAEGLELRFIQPSLSPYSQKANTFVPALSLLDLLMHLPREEVARRARQDWIWLPEQKS